MRVSELPGLHVPRMAMWRARFTFEPLDPRADAKAIAELKTCRAVTSADRANAWYEQNRASVQEKKTANLPKWLSKPESDRPMLRDGFGR